VVNPGKPEYISLFVPVYNEEDILEENLNKIYQEMSSITPYFRIYIVDDNSNDQTEAVGRRIERRNPKIRYLRHNKGPTRRENLAISFKKGKGDIIAFMDLDLATELKYTKYLIEEIEKGADITIGSRYLYSSSRERRLSRHLISVIFNTIIRIIFGSNVKDHECGFKSFKRNVIIDLLNDLGYDESLKRSVFWDAQMLIIAQRKGYKVVEFPIEWSERSKSALNFSSEKNMIPYIMRLKIEYLKRLF